MVLTDIPFEFKRLQFAALHNYLSFFGIDSLADVNIVCDRGSNFVCAFKDFEPIFCYEHRLNNIVKVTFFQNKKKQADTVVVDVKNGVDVKPFCTKTAGGNEKEIHESSSDDSELSTDDDSVNETALPVFRKKKKFVKKYLSSQNNTLSSQMKMTVDQIPLSAKHVIEVFKKCKKIVKYVKKIGINTDIKEESGVTLHQSCIVRWLSMSNLLESILKSFKTTKRLLLARNKHSLIYDLNVLTIKQLVLVLKPVKHIVTLVQTGNSPCLHLVLLCNLTLKRALSSYGSLLDYVNTYCNSNDNLSDKCENEENENYELEDDQPPNTSTDDGGDCEYDSDEYGSNTNPFDELDQYLIMKIDKSLTTNNPLDFWRYHSKQFPLLSKLAKRIYSIPATSYNVERQFSSAGLVINQRRTNINPEQVDNILLIRSFKKL
ncbi:unnamed protein product [Rotaria sp. Silwood1]|nr:unnamed protein product [Rotaria sp. Silwood1]